MKLTFSSTRFLAALDQRIANVRSRTASARITVPEELIWWYFQEFGTASRATMGTSNPDGYEIVPIHGDFLKFPGKDGETVYSKAVHHPGVYPRAFIRRILDDIVNAAMKDVGQALLANGYSFDAVAQALIDYSLPRAKEMIVQSMAEELTGTRHYHSGRSASEMFAEGAQIVDTTST